MRQISDRGGGRLPVSGYWNRTCVLFLFDSFVGFDAFEGLLAVLERDHKVTACKPRRGRLTFEDAQARWCHRFLSDWWVLPHGNHARSLSSELHKRSDFF